MKSKYYKTEHFLFRQWDRGIDDSIIDKIVTQLKKTSKTKAMVIAGYCFLKKIDHKVNRNANLIIILKGKTLVTLFYVDDLYAYLKSIKGNVNSIIL